MIGATPFNQVTTDMTDTKKKPKKPRPEARAKPKPKPKQKAAKVETPKPKKDPGVRLTLTGLPSTETPRRTFRIADEHLDALDFLAVKRKLNGRAEVIRALTESAAKAEGFRGKFPEKPKAS